MEEPEEWPLDAARVLDKSLRCTVCYELFRGPVSLACGHTCAPAAALLRHS